MCSTMFNLNAQVCIVEGCVYGQHRKRCLETLSFVKPLTVSFHITCTIFSHHLNHGAGVYHEVLIRRGSTFGWFPRFKSLWSVQNRATKFT